MNRRAFLGRSSLAVHAPLLPQPSGVLFAEDERLGNVQAPFEVLAGSDGGTGRS